MDECKPLALGEDTKLTGVTSTYTAARDTYQVGNCQLRLPIPPRQCQSANHVTPSRHVSVSQPITSPTR